MRVSTNFLHHLLFFVLLLNLLFPAACTPASAKTLATAGRGETMLAPETLRPPMVYLVKLTGATSYEINELFHVILTHTTTVLEVKRSRFLLEPSRPGACLAEYQVKSQAEAFDLESGIYNLLKQYNQGEKKDIDSGLTFRPTADDLELAARIKPILATSNSITFTVTTASGQAGIPDSPYHENWSQWWSGHGFE